MGIISLTLKLFSEQNYGGTTYFIPENQRQTHVVYPPYMAYSGMPTDTSVAFMERTMQMKIHVRQSFFVGEGKWFSDFAAIKFVAHEY